MRKARKILNEMMIGLVVWLIPVLIILLIIAHNKIAMVLGVLWGGVWAAVLLLHMYRHLDIALDMDPKHAQGSWSKEAAKAFWQRTMSACDGKASERIIDWMLSERKGETEE